MNKYNVFAIDISKRNFEVYAISSKGKEVRFCLKRAAVLERFRHERHCTIVMEAGGGTHYWGRKFRDMGHVVKIIAPQFVKPFVLSNKNDRVDARAIYVAATSPGMRFVGVKSIEQQELQHLHRVRSRILKSRTAANNELRGMLLEYGVLISKGARGLFEASLSLSDSNDMSSFGKRIIERVIAEVRALDEELKKLDKEIESISKSHPVCQRLRTIPGVGPIIATAIVASVSDPAEFKNGRQFAASIGLVPRHVGTGGKTRNLSISKRGDKYIRSQLIHGARSLLYRAHSKKDALSRWATNIKQKRGWNRAAVALANKNARIIWAVLRYERDFSPVTA